MKPIYALMHYDYKWPLNTKPTKSSETSLSVNLSHTLSKDTKTKKCHSAHGERLRMKNLAL
jgi:hypothetical protein